MRAPDFDRILTAMLKTYDGISDLNFSVGHPLQVEDFGELKAVHIDPPLERLTPYQTEHLALTLMQGDRRLMRELAVEGSCDCSYSLSEEARFRVNIFRQRGQFAIVMRRLQASAPSLASLQLPAIFEEIAREKNGLVLVTGPTGSGKTTTLAALLNEVNEKQAVHVVTLEDPIEFFTSPSAPLSISASSGRIFRIIPAGCAPLSARRPKSFSWGKCVIVRRSRSRSWPPRPVTSS
jgi:twitching motility protein PilT